MLTIHSESLGNGRRLLQLSPICKQRALFPLLTGIVTRHHGRSNECSGVYKDDDQAYPAAYHTQPASIPARFWRVPPWQAVLLLPRP